MKALTFSDVLITPKYSDIESRKDVDLSTVLNRKITLNLPVISSNMKTITGCKMAIAMASHGGMGILHRFNSIEESLSEYKKTTEPIHDLITGEKIMNNNVGVSIGVQENDLIRFEKFYEAGARIFCIDVAHGHSKRVKSILGKIKQMNYQDITVIAGNVATGDGAYELADWGADVVKVGIGAGSCCTTRLMTGVGVPQLYAVKEVYEEFKRQGIDCSIISDGGINNVGDICKALKYSDAVMCGSLFAGTAETPGHVFRGQNQEFYKVYQGSASGENKSTSGYAFEYIEGISKTVLFRGKVKHILREIENGIQSSFSYVGAENHKQFQEKCEFIEIGDASKMESKL